MKSIRPVSTGFAQSRKVKRKDRKVHPSLSPVNLTISLHLDKLSNQ